MRKNHKHLNQEQKTQFVNFANRTSVAKAIRKFKVSHGTGYAIMKSFTPPTPTPEPTFAPLAVTTVGEEVKEILTSNLSDSTKVKTAQLFI